MEFSQYVRSFFDRIADRPWAAVSELLLIGTVVYLVLRMLQGTRGARLVRSVVSILAISFAVVWLVADRFGLERINALYPYFILGVFLVSLVAFQTELRQILAKIGEGRFFQSWTRSPERSLAEIIQSVERLSEKRIGALIAIERTTETGAWIESGVAINADVSSELIEAIFQPSGPLHDLGLIIRGGRIVAAGCQFPLVESGTVHRSLGSRHRAAIGLSLESDALVVVVSEETGNVSLAAGGQLRRGLSIQQLREALMKELAIPIAVLPMPGLPKTERVTARIP